MGPWQGACSFIFLWLLAMLEPTLFILGELEWPWACLGTNFKKPLAQFWPTWAWTQPGPIFRRACKGPHGVNFGNIGANFNPDWVEPGPTWRRFSPAWYQSPSFPLSRFPLSFPPSPPFPAGRNAQSDSMTSRLCFEVAMGG